MHQASLVMDDSPSVESSLLELSDESFSTTESLDSELESEASSIFLDDSLESSIDDSTENVEALTIDASFRQPLYDGAKLSTFESYLLIMNYSLRHSLTKQAVSDLLNLVGMHLPTSMASHYKLKNFFQDLYADIAFKIHYCCSLCHSPFDDAKAVCRHGCDGTAMEFLTISVEAQLKRKLEGTQSCISLLQRHLIVHLYLHHADPFIWENLQKRFERNQDSGCLKDVLDGREYGNHKDFLSEPGNVSLTLNTDGVNMFHSSNISLWPIWLAVNELPPQVRLVMQIIIVVYITELYHNYVQPRFSKSNLLLAGLWFGDVKPTMTTFLTPFMKEINSLSCKGI